MSSRYGRNKRRAHRAQIAELEKGSMQLHEMFIREARRRREFADKADFLMDRIRLWDEEIRGLLGPYTSFAIDDVTYRVDHPDQIRQLPVMPPRPTMFSIDTMIGQESLEYYIATMLSFFTSLDERDLDRLRRLITLRIQVGSDHARDLSHYAISEQTWEDLKRAGPDAWRRLTYRIAGDMVRLLAQPKKKPGGDDMADSMRFAMEGTRATGRK